MKKIIIIGGDPNSINSEIILKSWKRINKSLKRIYLISNFKLIKEQSQKLKLKTKIIKVANVNEKSNDNALKILNINLNYKSALMSLLNKHPNL